MLKRVVECNSQRYCLFLPQKLIFKLSNFLLFVFLTCSLLFWSQGGWESDESMEQAALRETIEEAGVIGSVEVST